MKTVLSRLGATMLFVACATAAAGQTVDEVVEKCLAATGGRAALAKLKSRSSTGVITLSTPVGELAGSIETLNAVPNKSRTLIKVDLTSVGAGQLTLDRRFNGTTGYVIDTLQGNRDITGNDLDNLRNNSFPTPLLTYKEMGAVARIEGKEKVGDREAFLLVFEPPNGSAIRQYIDTETYLPVKAVVKLDVPQLGRQVEQTSEFFDFKEVDGLKIPFRITATSEVQRFTIELKKVEHNVPVDEALFSKPAAQ